MRETFFVFFFFHCSDHIWLYFRGHDWCVTALLSSAFFRAVESHTEINQQQPFWFEVALLNQKRTVRTIVRVFSLAWWWRVGVHGTDWHPSAAVFYLFPVCMLRHWITRFFKQVRFRMKEEPQTVWVFLFFFPLSHSGLFCSPLPNQAWGLLSTPVPVQTTAG